MVSDPRSAPVRLVSVNTFLFTSQTESFTFSVRSTSIISLFLFPTSFEKERRTRIPDHAKTTRMKRNFFIKRKWLLVFLLFLYLYHNKRGLLYYLAITSNGSDFLVFFIFASTVSISAVWVPTSISFSSLIATVCSVSVGRIFASFPSI